VTRFYPSTLVFPSFFVPPMLHSHSLTYHRHCIMLDTDIVLMFVNPCIIVQFIRKIQQDATKYQNVIIPYLYEAQHISGNTPPIIRSLKLHWQPLVFHAWKVVRRVVGGRCVAQNMLSFIQIWNNKILIHCCILLDFLYEYQLTSPLNNTFKTMHSPRYTAS
jgi:hypothetical protein